MSLPFTWEWVRIGSATLIRIRDKCDPGRHLAGYYEYHLIREIERLRGSAPKAKKGKKP